MGILSSAGREFRRRLAGLAHAAAVALALLALAGSAAPASAQVSEGQILVTDRLLDGVVKIDPDGSQTQLPIGGPINSPRGLALDGDYFLYLTSTSGAVWRVSTEDGGSQQLIRAGSPLVAPRGIVVAPRPDGFATNGLLYVAEKPGIPPLSLGAIWLLDPVTDSIGQASSGGLLDLPLGLARESSGTLLATSGSTLSFNGVYRIDPAAFDASHPADNQSIVSERGYIVIPRRLVIQADAGGETQAVFVTDSGGQPLGSTEVYPPQVLCIDATRAFDPVDPFANQTQVSTGGLFQRPVGIALEDPGMPGETDSGSLLVADADAEAVIRVTFTPGNPLGNPPSPCPVPGSDDQQPLSQGGLLDLPWDLQIVPPFAPFVPRPFYLSDTAGYLYRVIPELDQRQEILPGTFSAPTGVALDPVRGPGQEPAAEPLDLIVLDGASVYRVFDPAGTPSSATVSTGGLLSGPTGVVVDSEGDLLVVDRAEKRIVRVRPDGSQALIAQSDLVADPLDPLIDPVSAALTLDGELIVADAGDSSNGHDPRLVVVNPATGDRSAVAPPPPPPLPPLFDLVMDSDGTILMTGQASEKLLRLSSLVYQTENDAAELMTPRGVGIDADRSVLVVDAGDESPGTADGAVWRVDTLLPAATVPDPVPTGGDLYDPFGIEVDIPPTPPVLDLDADGVPDGRDNCALVANPPSVCAMDERTPCTPDDDECAGQNLGPCVGSACSLDPARLCSHDSDCVVDLGSCMRVCSGDATAACSDDPDCQVNLGSCVTDVCSGDGGTHCTTDSECSDLGLGACLESACSGSLTTTCDADSDCFLDLGSCLDPACSDDPATSCDPDVTKCEALGRGDCIQLDEDGDERGNACDNCQLAFNTEVDNPDILNAQFPQPDQDGDNFGDACDPTCDINGNGVVDSADIALYDTKYDGSDGACSLDLEPCDPMSPSCAAQTCDGVDPETMLGACSLDGSPCADASACGAQSCGPSPADCDGDGDVDTDDRDILVMEEAIGLTLGPGVDFDEDFLADELDDCPDDFDPSVCSIDGQLCCDDANEDFCQPYSPCDDVDLGGGTILTQICDQPDLDGDGLGDACNDAFDFDGDELADSLDNCGFDPNPPLCSLDGTPCRYDTDCPGSQTCEQPDDDDDGVGDRCDTCLGSADLRLCSGSGEQCSADADCPTGEVCNTQDIDGDLVLNSCDICPNHFDPRRCSLTGDVCRFDSDCAEEGETCLPQPDQDGDLLGDACDPDPDGDGIGRLCSMQGTPCIDANDCPTGETCDENDLCPSVADPLQEDEDGDGFGDVCDPCLGNPDTNDDDLDGIHDVCDNCPSDFNLRFCSVDFTVCVTDAECPAGQTCLPQGDDDGDGQGDACDICPLVSDPRVCSTTSTTRCQFDSDCPGGETCLPQPDEDMDGFGDACDPCLNDNVTDDDDGDLIHNGCDDCPMDYNPRLCSETFLGCVVDEGCPAGETCLAQADTDGDGAGDACDPDIDEDGVLNDADNCPYVDNPDQFDASADGIGRACDADYNDDSVVGGPDYVRLTQLYGSSTGDARYDPDVDQTGDGVIGGPDFLRLIQAYGSPPGPGKPGCDGSVPVPAACSP